MKKLLLSLLIIFGITGIALAAGPTVEEQNRIQFTAADQETTASYRIDYIVWASFTGSVIVNADVLNLEDGAGTEILKMSVDTGGLSPVIIPVGGIIVTGLKAEDLSHGYVTVYGKRR